MPEAPPLRVVAWELTRRCKLHCQHCRGNARDETAAEELTHEQGLRLLAGIADCHPGVLILTGGDPLLRPDLFTLIDAARSLDLRLALAACGPGLTPDMANKLRQHGIQRLSLSLDGATAQTHDSWRGSEGAFLQVVSAAHAAREAGLSFQINTTLHRNNRDELEDILTHAAHLGAEALDIFFLVPTGRAATLRALCLRPDEYWHALKHIRHMSKDAPIPLQTTCAPQVSTLSPSESLPPRGGCIGGAGFLFISHRGDVQPCGFVPLVAGNVQDPHSNIQSIYQNAPVFKRLRDREQLQAPCGACDHRARCGGCRARAFAASADWMGGDPLCP